MYCQRSVLARGVDNITRGIIHGSGLGQTLYIITITVTYTAILI